MRDENDTGLRTLPTARLPAGRELSPTHADDGAGRVAAGRSPAGSLAILRDAMRESEAPADAPRRAEPSLRPRVLHLLDSLAMGGKEKFTVSLACHQKRRGLDVAIARFRRENEFESTLREAGVPTYMLQTGGLFDHRLVRAIRCLVAREGWELVHAHNEASIVYAALASFGGRRVPLVATLHNGARDDYTLKNKLENRFAFARAQRIVCVADAIAASLREREFGPMHKVSVIANGVPEWTPPSEAELRLTRMRLEVPPDAPVVLFVGRLDPIKNLPGLLGAFRLALHDRPDAVLLLAGDGPMRAYVADVVSVLRLSSNVRLLGTRQDVATLLGLADVFVLASFREGHSISLLEACSMGKAIAASARGGNPDTVSHGVSALLFDPDEVGDMAACLTRLLRDPPLRASLGRAALERFRAEFGMEKCHRAYADVYGQLLGRAIASEPPTDVADRRLSAAG